MYHYQSLSLCIMTCKSLPQMLGIVTFCFKKAHHLDRNRSQKYLNALERLEIHGETEYIYIIETCNVWIEKGGA